MVLVTDPHEVIAAWEGELGDWDWYASDDETWVDRERLAAWRAKPPRTVAVWA